MRSLAVHPVKSLAPVGVERVDVTPIGLAGDRGAVVVDAGTGERLREKSAPGLAGVTPTGDDAADAEAVTAAVGRRVRIEPAAQPAVMIAAVHLVGAPALTRAVTGDVPEGCSAADPRANLVLDLPVDEDERSWVGCTLAVGGAVLRVTRTPRHCLGVYAEVITPGRVAVGDPVNLFAADTVP